MTLIHSRAAAMVLPLCLAAGACDDSGGDAGDDGGQTEVITTVSLNFAPDGGGPAITAAFRDPDGAGGTSGTADPIDLAIGTTYTLTVAFEDEFQSPPADITVEIEAEAEEHQILIYGSAVDGPAQTNPGAPVTHAYADTESAYGPNAVGDDLEVGLENTITTVTAGGGEFKVMLRHLPEINGNAQKTAGLAESFAGGTAIAGDVDADVTFQLTVM